MKNKNLKTIESILSDVKENLKKIYGRRLKKIILYGSYARGEATEGSDIDIIILLEGMKNSLSERDKFFDAIWQLDLKYDTIISIFPFDENQYRTRKLPIILNAKKEGIPI